MTIAAAKEHVDNAIPSIDKDQSNAAFPLFGTGLGVMGLLGWRRKRKAAAALAAA